MMNEDQMQIWEQAARLQEFQTRGAGYAGPSRQGPKEKAEDLARFREMEQTIAANGAKLTAAEQAKHAEKAARDAVVNHSAYKPHTRIGLPETDAEAAASRAKRIAELRKRNQK